MSDNGQLIPSPNFEIIESSGVSSLLDTIRPYWQGKNLIDRVRRLLPTDPSSACQRIFNATIHDLKEKLVMAGVDIAAEAANQNKLPPISKAEEIEEYSAHNTIELAYRVGLISRPESRRLFRVYDIRGDLEHEDDEYEATIEDCIYVFKTCIECVLSKDPVVVIKLKDIKEIVEQPESIVVGQEIVVDYMHAPDIRQAEIYEFLISNAVNREKLDIVRQNCYTALVALKPHTHNPVIIDSATNYVKRIGRGGLDLLHARVAIAAGIFPYLKKVQAFELFSHFLAQMKDVGYSFRSHAEHGELLRNLKDIGGLIYCPIELRKPILEWLILCFIGEQGGYGAGQGRRVFYSNIGAPLAFELIEDAKQLVIADVDELIKKSSEIRRALVDSFIERRLENIQDIFISP